MDREEAVMVSKLVNCSSRALEMHAEQRRDATWQYVAAVTNRGSRALPSGESLRTIAGRFGVAHDTVRRMLRKLPNVSPEEYHEVALDPGTGFPRWRYVREGGAGWLDMKEKMDVEQLTQREAERLAKKIATLMDKASPEAARRAVQMLGIEAQMEAANEDAHDFSAANVEAADF
jgi:predicted transcriptional regulator